MTDPISNDRLAEMLAEVQAATAAAIGEWPYKASAGVTFDTMCSILTELQSLRQSSAGVEHRCGQHVAYFDDGEFHWMSGIAPLFPARPTMVSEAGVYTCRGISELHSMVAALAAEGFRIITVIDTQNGDCHVVAQKEPHNG